MIIPLNNGITTSILDYDAREFIRVAGVTDETQIRAINELCKDLKREGFWNSFYRCLPFVYAGTTASMLVCLKTRISFSLTTTPGGITFSNTGVQFGLTSAISTSALLPLVGELNYGGHISIYNRTATDLSINQSHGSYGNNGLQRFTGTSIIFGTASNGIGNMYASFYNASTYNVTGSPVNSPNPDGFNGNPRFNSFTYSGNNTGLFVYSTHIIQSTTASMTNPWLFYMSKNGTQLGLTWSVRNFSGQAAGPRIGNGLFAAVNSLTGQSYQEICWWSIGGGNSTTSNGGPIPLANQSAFYQIVQKFQTTLGRQV